MSWEKVQISHKNNPPELQSFHFTWHVALPAPSDTLGMLWHLGGPGGCVIQCDSWRQEDRQGLGPGIRKGELCLWNSELSTSLSSSPKCYPYCPGKGDNHHQGGCAQRPAGPTQTSSFVSAELLCHRQDSQCFCTSLQAPKFSVCNPAQALAGFVASSSFRCVVHLRVQLWVCSFPSTAFLLSLTHAYSRLRWSAE